MSSETEQLSFKKGLQGLAAFNLEKRCLGDGQEQGWMHSWVKLNTELLFANPVTLISMDAPCPSRKLV